MAVLPVLPSPPPGRFQRPGAAAAALLCCLTLPGCLAAAVGAGAGVLVAREMAGTDVYTSMVRLDVEEVWFVAKDVFGILSSVPLEVEDFPRTLFGKVDSAQVTVEVLAYDLGRTTIKVRAKKLGFSDGSTAERVLNTIQARLKERNGSLE
jgi:hypothetical protein